MALPWWNWRSRLSGRAVAAQFCRTRVSNLGAKRIAQSSMRIRLPEAGDKPPRYGQTKKRHRALHAHPNQVLAH